MITHNLFWEDPYKNQASIIWKLLLKKKAYLKNHFFILQVEANHESWYHRV